MAIPTAIGLGKFIYVVRGRGGCFTEFTCAFVAARALQVKFQQAIACAVEIKVPHNNNNNN